MKNLNLELQAKLKSFSALDKDIFDYKQKI